LFFMSGLSSPRCLVFAGMFWPTCPLACMFWSTCPLCPVQADLSGQPCPQWAGAANLSLRSCVLPWLSFSGCPVLEVLSCVVLFQLSSPAILSQLCCPSGPFSAALSQLCCPGWPVLAVLSQLPYTGCLCWHVLSILSRLSWPRCTFLAVLSSLSKKTGSLVLPSCWLPWPVLEKFIWRINSNERKTLFLF
jgi:hypothetical protein